MSEQPDVFSDYDAAYLMGALDPHDRRAFETHLSDCPKCSAAVAELAGMPGLLAQVPAEQMLAPRSSTVEPLPETLLPRTVMALRRERRRRRAWISAVGSAAAAVLIAVTVVITGALSTSQPSSNGSPRSTSHQIALVMTEMPARSPVPVTATIRLDPVAWGTRVNLTCTYGYSEGSGESTNANRSYRLVVVPTDGGRVQQVAQWIAFAGKTETPTGSTDLKPAQISDIRLLDSRGDTLLHVSPSA